MFETTSRASAMLVALVLAVVCAGCSVSTEGTMYDIGIKAIKQDQALSQGGAIVTPAPQTKCTFYIGKSSASIEIPYTVGGGASSEGVYVVWMNRIGTVWEFDRSTAVPKRK